MSACMILPPLIYHTRLNQRGKQTLNTFDSIIGLSSTLHRPNTSLLFPNGDKCTEFPPPWQKTRGTWFMAKRSKMMKWLCQYTHCLDMTKWLITLGVKLMHVKCLLLNCLPLQYINTQADLWICTQEGSYNVVIFRKALSLHATYTQGSQQSVTHGGTEPWTLTNPTHLGHTTGPKPSKVSNPAD